MIRLFNDNVYYRTFKAKVKTIIKFAKPMIDLYQSIKKTIKEKSYNIYYVK